MICRDQNTSPEGSCGCLQGKEDALAETKPQALIYEYQEELNITVSVGNPFMEVTHTCSDVMVQLHISCPDCGGLSKKLEHNDIR